MSDHQNRILRNAEAGHFKRNWKVSPGGDTHKHSLYGMVRGSKSLNVQGRLVYHLRSKPLEAYWINNGWLSKRWASLEDAKKALWEIWRATSRLTDRHVKVDVNQALNIDAAVPDVVIEVPHIDRHLWFVPEIYPILIQLISDSSSVRLLARRVLKNDELYEAVITVARLDMEEELRSLLGSLLSAEERSDVFVATGTWVS